jgi:hypothetical protein
MISSIIFSKDRALQLDLLLNSIYQNFPETLDDVRVIWTASSERFKLGYQTLQSEHPKIVFKQQTPDFFYDFYENICIAHYKYICLFTDDDIVYRKVNANGVNLLDDFNFVCYSLRLGHNILYRDTLDEQGQAVVKPDIIPPLYHYNGFTIWNRHSIPPGGYWAYPYSVDGHIFRKEIISYIAELIMHWSNIEKFHKHPNQLEAKMQRFNCENGAMMICDEISSIINSPNNRVQNVFENRHGDYYSFSQEHCNNLYLTGQRIKLDKIQFGEINKAHKELNILESIEGK